jgi:hypothetical protein
MLVGDKEVSNVEMSGYLHDEARHRRSSWWLYALIVAVIAIIAIFIHYYRSGSTLPFGNRQSIETK